jgi:nitrogen-specific signal transduction histidine kinase
LFKRRYRLALEVQVIDDGPGIGEDIRERMFYPLVSGREGGSGLGLTWRRVLSSNTRERLIVKAGRAHLFHHSLAAWLISGRFLA